VSNKQRVKKVKDIRICDFADFILSLFEERIEVHKDTDTIVALGFEYENSVVVTEFETLQELKDEQKKGFRLAVFAGKNQIRRFWDNRHEFDRFLEHGEDYHLLTNSAFLGREK